MDESDQHAPPGLNSEIPVLGFCAASGTGKTTLLRKLLPLLRARGMRVGVVKHTHHAFEVDRPGKDSYELRKAGACEMLIASGKRWALMADTEMQGDPELGALLKRVDRDNLDLVLVEGFRHEPIPKIELHRSDLNRPLIFPEDPHVIAVACVGPLHQPTKLPVLELGNPESIASFIIEKML